MSRLLSQLDLFGRPVVPVNPQTPVTAKEPPAPSQPVYLPGQLTLQEARSTRLSPICEALAAGHFAPAAKAAAALRSEPAIARALDALAAAVAGCSDAEELASLDLGPLCAQLTASSALASAARRGRAVAVAQQLEAQHPEARAQGQLAAGYWLSAGRAERALATLDLLLARNAHHVEALVLRGNLLHGCGEIGRARVDYRRALRTDAKLVRLEQIADEEVRHLATEAADLGLAPVEPWLPFVGLLTGVFPLVADAIDRPATAADRFEAALLRCRASQARGRFDLEARRELKRLAPELFARLLEEGMA